MYLKDILIENAGPITEFDLTLPFRPDGSPKPVVFVGANGSGKTILQATIADALIQMAAPHFRDVSQRVGLGLAFFKITGGSNQRVNTPFGLSLLAFEHKGKRASYVDKSGTIPTTNHPNLGTRFPSISWAADGGTKEVKGFNAQEIREIFTLSSNCFFPSSRREIPHWLNPASINELHDKNPVLNDAPRYSDILEKPLYIERCREQVKQWILDVIFDSRFDVEIAPPPPTGGPMGLRVAPSDNITNRFLLKTTLENVNLLLRTVLDDASARLQANYRAAGSRIHIARGNSVAIPSLDGLSLGQSLLFNMFCTIVRYSDFGDLNKGGRLSEITGIVIIDEIDAHLHTDLQYLSLPKLIKLFPKVQFIISTHAPIFLLGMEKEFGSDGLAIFEMPHGQQITTERFSEFAKSLEYYKETKAFEEMERQLITASNKPIILLEGDTDKDYLIAYLHLMVRADILQSYEIDWAGRNAQGVARNGGKDSLDSIAKTFKNKPSLLKNKLLLIYDCDCNKEAESINGMFFVRRISLNEENTKVRCGIENLLPSEIITEEFYETKINDKGEKHQTLKKRQLCDWVTAQNNSAHYSKFQLLLDFINELSL